MNRLTLKHLRYFEALARHGHFGRAAEACAISQPALSLQIRELEEILGAPLAERTARRIRLTPLGAAFARRARAVLADVHALEDLARAAAGPLSGPLQIGVIPTVAPYLLPRVITALAAHLPGLDPRPREAVTEKLIEELMDGRLDAAIVALPVSEPTLHEQPLFSEEFVLVRPLADADRPVPSSDMLREMRLLLLEEGHCFRDQALAFCAMSAARPRDVMEGTSLATLVQMVGAGLGVTLIPEMAVGVETRSAPVSVARLAPPRPTRTIGMVWRNSSPLSEPLSRLSGVVRNAVCPGGEGQGAGA
ncbi:LysR substrate-binding domain-containing protein [Futiania mangrovi]|uniref:LysR substrate-binding domain-containing protein n=1 Tax=Futiania mangrovi TaxID=2959716 RepID=A0A9J6PEP2_9PROT|nr:LysR substrate-binding domain-containing protein [Futiania mangrovii]MCP1337893.1 LysR substrate-binding domain-containing protein [Futiania mangrovii]